jgi:ribonuclease R
MLDDLYVEGLIHVTGLPKDYYFHEASQHRMVGERTGRVFRLGQRLRVKLVRVNLEERKIDFQLVDSALFADTSKTSKTSKKASQKPKASTKARELAGEYVKKRKSKSKKSTASTKAKVKVRAKKSRAGSPAVRRGKAKKKSKQ